LNIDNEGDKWIVAEFFNSIHSQGIFVDVLRSIAAGEGYVVNEEYCIFPDLLDMDENLHFEGVMFGTFNDDVIISRPEFNFYLDAAVKRYLELHPEDELTIKEIMRGCGD
jgi:hypothetical protein